MQAGLSQAWAVLDNDALNNLAYASGGNVCLSVWSRDFHISMGESHGELTSTPTTGSWLHSLDGA